MSKKRNKNRNRRKKRVAAAAASAAGPLDATEWRNQLNTFIQAAAWQHAVKTALDIHRIGDCARQEDAQRCAAVAEAALRELMEIGKENRFRSLAETIHECYPQWVRHWPLGLQVACRSVPDLAAQLNDPIFVERLRREIWDPMESAWSGHPELRRDADLIIKAWNRTEQRDFAGARRALDGIRRQSVLADWRLLLQANMAAHLQDDAGTKAALQRMNTLAPPRRIAALLLSSGAAQPASPALASLQSFIQRPTLRSDMEKIVREAPDTDTASLRRVVDQAAAWHRAGCHELASAVAVSFGDRDDDEEVISDLLEALETIDPRLSVRCNIRAIVETEPGKNASAEFQVQTLSHAFFNERLKWSQHEHAIIGLLLCRALRDLAEEAASPFMGAEKIRWEELMDPQLLVDVARHALAKWPELEDLYELWIRAERELPRNPCEALGHWARMNPDNVHVLVRCIEDLIANQRFKRATAALSKLKQFPGEQRAYQALREKLLLAQCEEAYANNKPVFLREALGQLDGISAQGVGRIRALHVLLSRPNATTAELYNELATIFDNPWEIPLTILRSAPNRDQGDPLKAMAPLMKRDADALARKWLEVAQTNDQTLVVCGLLPPIQDMLDVVLKNLKRPTLVFEMVFRIVQQTFTVPSTLMSDGYRASDNQMVASSMWLTRCGEEEWVPVGFGLAGCILLSRALDDHFDFGVDAHFVRPLGLLFGAMHSHPCQGPAIQRIWDLALQHGLDEIATPQKLNQHAIKTMQRALQHVRSITGLHAKIGGLKTILSTRTVPRPSGRKKSCPERDTQMRFPDWIKTNE